MPKIKLSELINLREQIDLLKMDIEGSEGDVIREIDESGRIQQVKHIIMEFHHDPNGNPDNSLEEMLHILERNNFTIEEAHITIARGMRRKRNIPPAKLGKIAHINKKIFLTFSAMQKSI